MADLPETIPDLVHVAADRFGDVEAMVDGDQRFSYAELVARIDTAARGFIAHGVDPGDRVALWAPNCWEWAVCALATHCVGAVLVPLNTRFKGPEAADIIRRSGTRRLFTVTDFLGADYTELLEPTGATHDLDEVVVLRGPVPDGCTSFTDFQLGADQSSPDESRKRAAAVTGDDPCDILFTSGTTGAPKGAVLRHGTTIRAFDFWADGVGLRRGDRYLIVNPFFHAFGLKAGILACFLKGATMVPQPVFDVPEVMRLVERERITMLPGPPAIFQSILNHPDREKLDLSTLRISATGAATIPVEMVKRMFSDLGFEQVVTAYGLTESHGIVTMCRPGDDPETIATTSGRPIDGVELRLVDDEGAEVERGQPGEVLVRGYTLMTEYLDDPEATASTIVDGWLHTGDIGVQDEAGNLTITDRKKDMFIVGGFNAYPAEIEQMMAAHPAVAAVAVVGAPDERMGEVAMAFVVPASGQSLTEPELIAWCRENMANYKVPRYVEFVGELPLNASAKVMKTVLRDQARTRAAADTKG